MKERNKERERTLYCKIDYIKPPTTTHTKKTQN